MCAKAQKPLKNYQTFRTAGIPFMILPMCMSLWNCSCIFAARLAFDKQPLKAGAWRWLFRGHFCTLILSDHFSHRNLHSLLCAKPEVSGYWLQATLFLKQKTKTGSSVLSSAQKPIQTLFMFLLQDINTIVLDDL